MPEQTLEQIMQDTNDKLDKIIDDLKASTENMKKANENMKKAMLLQNNIWEK